MINMSTVTAAIAAAIAADTAVSAWLGKPVVDGDYINEDPGMTPWVGVYRGSVGAAPRTLGNTSTNYESTSTFKVIVQATSYASATECGALLDGYVQDIVDAVYAAETIIGVLSGVDKVNSYKVDYGYLETDRTSLFFQMAIITFEVEGMA